MTFISRFGEMRDHVGLAERAHRLECHQFRIARADADANQLSGAHRPALASALTAAAHMALPPMRPRTMMNGTPRGSAASAAFELGSAYEADRNAEDRRRLRRALIKQIEQAEQGRRRIADGDHGAGEAIDPQIERRRRARRADLFGDAGRARIVERADHVIARRKTGAGNAVRHHLGIAKDWRAGGERPPRRSDDVAAEHDVRRRFDLTAGVNHAHRHLGLVHGKP